MLTLRQIEIVRAVMIAGSIAGAARLLNISAPGISRMLKHTEDSLGFPLFERAGGRLVPSPVAAPVFSRLNAIHTRLEDLTFAIERLGRGETATLKIASVPSLAAVMVPRAVAALVSDFPGLSVDIDIIRLEEATDALLVRRADIAVLSGAPDHPGIAAEPLPDGRLVCIAARAGPLGGRTDLSIAEIAAFPLIGIDPGDPHGRIVTALLADHGLSVRSPIRARFGTTVMALVRRDLGLGVVDIFTVAEAPEDLVRLPIREPTTFPTFTAHRRGEIPALFAERFRAHLAAAMAATAGTGSSGA